MPNKKTGKKNKNKNLGDVTINDFANSTVCKNRTKKINPVSVLKKSFEEDKSWDEKSDEFDGEFVEQENEDGTVSYVIKKVEVRRRRKTVSQSDDSGCHGNEYPIDIWFIISEYIRPEDVGRFACICKSTYAVVSTAKFWFNLYRRYYCTKLKLPIQLEPASLARKYSLRTSVIRALHYMYNPFIDRLKLKNEEHPDKLTRRECILVWHEEKKNHWFYYFKMKEKTVALNHSKYKKSDLLDILDDVSANQDENCQILQITCRHFVSVPPVLGFTLTSVLFTLSKDFMYHKLQLGFNTGIQNCVQATDGSTVVILDPVINVKVLDWWHPLYPHSHNMEHLLNQE